MPLTWSELKADERPVGARSPSLTGRSAGSPRASGCWSCSGCLSRPGWPPVSSSSGLAGPPSPPSWRDPAEQELSAAQYSKLTVVFRVTSCKHQKYNPACCCLRLYFFNYFVPFESDTVFRKMFGSFRLYDDDGFCNFYTIQNFWFYLKHFSCKFNLNLFSSSKNVLFSGSTLYFGLFMLVLVFSYYYAISSRIVAACL